MRAHFVRPVKTIHTYKYILLNMSDKYSCFICGTVFNVEPYIDKVFSNIKKLASSFKEIRIILSYDASSDNTLARLLNYKSDPDFPYQIDMIINQNPRTNIRTQNISNARNRILEHINNLVDSHQCPLNEWTHMIMMDMDDKGATYFHEDVLERALMRDDWDSISFNRLWYYDIWALSLKPFVYSYFSWKPSENMTSNLGTDPGTTSYIMREHVVSKLRELDRGELLECQSAFNGFAIYKTAKFLDCRYDWRIPVYLMSLSDLEENRRAFALADPTVPFHEVSFDPDCEHRHFHLQAIRKNQARIRISPEILFLDN